MKRVRTEVILAASLVVILMVYVSVLRWCGVSYDLIAPGSSYWGEERWLGILGLLVIIISWGYFADWLRKKL
jgi:hypothetical protein